MVRTHVDTRIDWNELVQVRTVALTNAARRNGVTFTWAETRRLVRLSLLIDANRAIAMAERIAWGLD
jgi:hypothetical protein